MIRVNMTSRKKTPTDIETQTLTKSARRCPICFYLDGDLKEKEGQIAHLDQDPNNVKVDNLAFLCLMHHSKYDSKTSQHKNYTLHEIKTMRDMLYIAIADRKHHAPPSEHLNQIGNSIQDHDRKIYLAGVDIMAEEDLIELLDELWGGHNYWDLQLSKASRYHQYLEAPSKEYLNPELIEAAKSLARHLRELAVFCCQYFWVYPENQTRENFRLCLFPSGNIDRSFHPTPEQSKRYDELEKILGEKIFACQQSYEDYRRKIKHTLHI